MLLIKSYRQTPGWCAPACLKMVAGYFGINKSEAALARLAGASRRRGASAQNLLAAAKQLGLKGLIKDNAGFGDIKKYLNRKIPIIADWFSPYGEPDGHYSVVVGLDKASIYLQDPELGKIRKLPRQIFQRLWFDFPGDFIKKKNDIILRRLIVIER